MIIELKNVSVAYDGKTALHPLNLEIEKNKITAVIGPSGCGKSTLLRCLNGIIREEKNVSFSGEVLLEGRDCSEIPAEELRKRVGLVFQTPSPFPFSIYKNMVYAPRYYGLRNKDEIDRIVENKLTLCGLWDEVKDDLNKSALKLSGGQQQRLCIARALTVEPDVLLLDEPCSALDVKSSGTIEKLLIELKEKYTIVIVTHNLAQAKRISDNSVFLYNGELIESGKTEELFSAPKKAETIDFLGGLFG